MKKYSVKPNKEQLKLMKMYWKKLQELESDYFKKVTILETNLSNATGIRYAEFFMSEYGYFCGIGNAERTMELIPDTELEKK
jgi:hypothetical protein